MQSPNNDNFRSRYSCEGEVEMRFPNIRYQVIPMIGGSVELSICSSKQKKLCIRPETFWYHTVTRNYLDIVEMFKLELDKA